MKLTETGLLSAFVATVYVNCHPSEIASDTSFAVFIGKVGTLRDSLAHLLHNSSGHFRLDYELAGCGPHDSVIEPIIRQGANDFTVAR